MTTEAQQTALEKPLVRVLYLVELQFSGSTARFNTTNQTVKWGGHEWIGVGTIGEISQVVEEDSIDSSPVNFSLAVPAMIAIAAGPVEAYRGRAAKMWMCPLDDSYQLIDDPVLCWSGIMDMMSIGIDGEAGKITLKCETAAYGLKRKQPLRLNAAQQKKRHPSDTGFDYLSDLIANPALWLSKKFQMQ